jgi:hypothetical protein
MKWYKHESDMHMREELDEFIDLFGAEGYGVLTIISEKIAMEMHKDFPERCWCKCTVATWARTCRVSKKKLLSMVEFLEKNGGITTEHCGNLLKISRASMLNVKDTHTGRRAESKGCADSTAKSLRSRCEQPSSKLLVELELDPELDQDHPPQTPLLDLESPEGDRSSEKKGLAAERASLKRHGIGTLDSKAEQINVLRYQARIGLTDEAIMALITPHLGKTGSPGGLGWRFVDGKFGSGKYSSRTLKAMLLVLHRDHGYTVDEIGMVIARAAHPDAFENRKWSYVLRPDVAEGLLADAKNPPRSKQQAPKSGAFKMGKFKTSREDFEAEETKRMAEERGITVEELEARFRKADENVRKPAAAS